MSVLRAQDKDGRDPIHIKASHEGRLHRALGIPEGRRIPLATLEAKLRTASPAEREEIEFAINSRHFHHGGRGK